MDAHGMETQCTRCNHLQVCSYKEQFLAAQKAVDNVTVITGNRSFVNLRDISWIQPIKSEIYGGPPHDKT